MDLKILAKKAMDGFMKGNFTSKGMELTNAEYLALNRRRKKEKLEKFNLFLYICWLVWKEYSTTTQEIIDRGIIAEIPLTGKKIYPELSGIDSNIILCLLMYAFHDTKQNVNKERYKQDQLEYLESFMKAYRSILEFENFGMSIRIQDSNKQINTIKQNG